MQTNLVLSILASVIMFVFAAIVLLRFVQRRSLHNLFWGVGLIMFGLGTFAEAYLATAWNESLFRSWYVFGAILNAGWLGHGSLNLLVRRPWVRYLTVVLLLLTVIGIAAGFTVPIDSSHFTPAKAVSEQYKEILPAGARVRLLTPLFNIYGSLFLIGGAVYSAYLYRRKRVDRTRMLGNLLIAAGAFVIAASGTLTRLFMGSSLYVAELTAAVLMFSGFMLANVPAAAPVSTPEQQTRTSHT